MRAICIGEAMIELAPAGPQLFRQSIAGDVFNTAAYLRQELGDTHSVGFLTDVGDDPMSALVTAAIAARGLDDGLVFRTPGRQPGLYMIELDPGGDRSFHYWRSASAARLWLRGLEARGGAEALAGADLVYFSGISLAILTPEERRAALALLEQARGHGGLLAFDPNIRPRLWGGMDEARRCVERACALSDIVLPSDVDGRLLWDEGDPARPLASYRAAGAKEIALTLGHDGALVAAADHEPERLASVATRVVDTAGGGDAFNGAYLAARLMGRSPIDSAHAGQRLAAAVVARSGALPELTCDEPQGATAEGRLAPRSGG
jgi:2-dehydro-3-deoxygluconokinase